jgi:hypothetical protein
MFISLEDKRNGILLWICRGDDDLLNVAWKMQDNMNFLKKISKNLHLKLKMYAAMI